jgi:hypothetical protein
MVDCNTYWRCRRVAAGPIESGYGRSKAAGTKEPAQDLPHVKVSPVQKQPVATHALRFVTQVDSQVTGVQPITVTLRITKQGGGSTTKQHSERSSWSGRPLIASVARD